MDKLKVLREKIKNLSLDSVLIFDERNQLYISDFAFSDGFLYITSSEAYLITDFRYYEAALKKADKRFKVISPETRVGILGKLISDTDAKRVGFEGGSITYERYKSFSEKYPSVEFVSIGNIIEEMRAIKSADEISKIQAAQDIADKAFSHVISVLTPNMTEIEVAAEIEYAMRKLGADGPSFDTIAVSGKASNDGADGPSFDTIAVSGKASALPHGTPRPVKLERGFLTMDFGARIDGYLSDMTRTVVIGKANEDMKKLYNTVLTAQIKAIEYLREGADAGEADKVARDIIDSFEEYKGTFGHSLGHSIGLCVHEVPSLSKKSCGVKLKIGQVTSVEPGIYLFGKYGCRIEDLVAIEKNGVYNFTKSTKELIEIY